ncbi:hypothetical protein KJ359_007804 [Pestalotiopsis sp. 9143b]|nr:hypothetical protein KJ359_007804 [Pestalotiopsis sp. 9143b]
MTINMSLPENDVVVYGATSGAIAAAVQSAKLGRKVVLVSPDEHIEQCLKEGIKDPDVWRFESRVAEQIIKEWLAEFSRKGPLDPINPIVRDSNRIRGLRLANGIIVSGRVFVEASYEGDMLAAVGITTTHGRESSSTYGESLAGVRDTTTYTQIKVPIDPYNSPGDSASGLIYGISPEPFGKAGDGDEHLAAFSYRVPLTDRSENRLPLYKPEGYDPTHYELHRRYIKAGGTLYTPRKRLPGAKTDLIGSEAPLATDLLGMNDKWATGTHDERQKILDDTALFTKGLLYFFANDDCLPAEFREEWSRFGYCLDEFPDNNHFPRKLYIRDARRMVSDYVITEHTASRDNGEEPVSDPVAIAYWPTDTHCVRRILRGGKVHNEGFIFKDGHRWRPFGIAYRSLVPRASEAENIITATCPSSSHVGYGAVRLEHQFYALGQACANACDIVLEHSVPFQQVPYQELKERLLQQGAILDVSKVGAPTFPGDDM